MKISPLSGDLLLKVALAAGAGLAVYVLVKRARGAVSGQIDETFKKITDAVDSITGIPGRVAERINASLVSGGEAAAARLAPHYIYPDSGSLTTGDFARMDRGQPPGPGDYYPIYAPGVNEQGMDFYQMSG